MSLAMRLSPRVNQDTLDRATLAGWRFRTFFGGRGVVSLIPPAGRHRAVERESHDEQQAGEPGGVLDLRVLDTKAS